MPQSSRLKWFTCHFSRHFCFLIFCFSVFYFVYIAQFLTLIFYNLKAFCTNFLLQFQESGAIIKILNIFLSFSFSYLSIAKSAGIVWSAIPALFRCATGVSTFPTLVVVVTPLGALGIVFAQLIDTLTFSVCHRCQYASAPGAVRNTSCADKAYLESLLAVPCNN